MQRFWDKVGDRGDPEKCWEWQGGKTGKGYGTIWYEGKDQPAHRVVLKITDNEFDKDQMVLHKCHNRSCVNPNHLYLGNASDNAKDASEHGTSNFAEGESHNDSKLSEKDVKKIYHRYNVLNHRVKRIAEDYPVTEGTIQHIVQGRTWTHITQA